MFKKIETEICWFIAKLFKANKNNNCCILTYKYLWENITYGIKNLFLTLLSKKCPNCKLLIKDYEWLQEQYDVINHELTGGMTTYGYLYKSDTIIELAEKHFEKFCKRDILDICKNHKGSKKDLIKEIEIFFGER